jgi:hypothetical protein
LFYGLWRGEGECMPKYIVEAKFETYRLLHHTHSEFRQRMSFEAKNNKRAFDIAFDPDNVPFRGEDKKLFRVMDVYGSTKRIYLEDC